MSLPIAGSSTSAKQAGSGWRQLLGFGAGCTGLSYLLAPATAAGPARGYQQQATRTKRGRTWAGYGIASAWYLAIIITLTAAV